MDNVVDLAKIKEEREWADSPFVNTDPFGVKWYTFLCEYVDGSSRFGFRIYATDFDDAERRLGLLRANATISGKLHSEIDG